MFLHLYKRILYSSPLRVSIQLPTFLIWQSLPEEIAEKFLWLFLHYFGNFTSQMSLFLQIGTVVGLSLCPLQAHMKKTCHLEGCQGITIPWHPFKGIILTSWVALPYPPRPISLPYLPMTSILPWFCQFFSFQSPLDEFCPFLSLFECWNSFAYYICTLGSM